MTFTQPEVVSFESTMSTGCGTASSSTGPSYCPPDQTIYIDLGFYDLLQSRYGACGGSLAEMYVAAHEYGHHIQQQSSGGIDPDTWTHGSSEERQRWFTTGYTEGTLAACDTFSASSL